MEKARRIPYDDCFPHESAPQAYWVRSQSIHNKKYIVNCYCADFIMCECPWSIRGNICNTIKVNWLYFNSNNSEPLCHQDAMANTFNELPNISIYPHNHSADVNIDLLATDSVDADAEALHFAREELFRYLQLIQNSPPTTLTKTIQLTDMVKKMLEESNKKHLMDFEFTVGVDALDLSLKRKKSFLSPKNKQRRKKQHSGMEIDLNVPALEEEPFQFHYLNKRGRPPANKALSMVPCWFQLSMRVMGLD